MTSSTESAADNLVVPDSEFDLVIDRTATHSTKWSKYSDKSILPAWLADMDFRSPPEVIKALQERVEHGVFGYSEVPESLTESIVNHLQQTYDWKIQPGWLCWLSAVMPGLNMATRIMGDQDDAMIIPTPVYHPFLDAPRYSHRPHVRVNLVRNKDQWEMDLDALDDALKKTAATLVIICNPQNPTGRVYTRKELEALADIVLRRGAFLCSDEIHCDLLLQPDLTHTPIASLAPDIANSCITLMAPTKTFNMPGLNFAFAVVPSPQMRTRYRAARMGMQPSLSPLSLAAAEAAYSHGNPWLQRLKAYLRGNAHILKQAIDELPGVQMTTVEATCLAWIDISERGINDPAPYFEQHGLGLSEGKQFDGEGFMRFTFGCPRKTLYEAIDRFRQAMADI